MLRALGLDPRLVAEPPQQSEVGVDLAVEHRLQVELDEGLSGQSNVVAEDAEPQSVADEAPEVLLRAVEELLHQAVRTGPLAFVRLHSLIEVLAKADQMDRAVIADVRDRVGFAVNLERLGGLQLTVFQRPPERQQPFGQCDGLAGIARRQFVRGGSEGLPDRQQAVPGVIGRLVDLLASQVIILGTKPLQAGIRRRDSLKQIGGQDGPLDADGGEGV